MISGELHETARQSFQLIAGIYGKTLHILARIHDQSLEIYEPGDENIINSDYAMLVVGDDYTVKEQFYFVPSVPGRFNPFQIMTEEVNWAERRFIRYSTNIIAGWQPNKDGYDLEIALPLDMVMDRLGLVVANRISDEKNPYSHVGTAGPDTRHNPGRVILPGNPLEEVLARMEKPPGRRVWILDSKGQVLASAGSLKEEIREHPLNLFYKAVLPSVSRRFQDDLAGASRLYGQGRGCY